MMKDDGTWTPEQQAQFEKLKTAFEKQANRTPAHTDWIFYFDDRQRKLIANCRNYAINGPAGLPGHNLMMIVSRMSDLLDSVKLAPMEVEGE